MLLKLFDCQYLFQYSKVAARLPKVSLLPPCATAANWEQAQCLCLPQSYDGFFLPNSRALLPTFSTNCPDGVSFCPDGVSFCPDFHPQPLFFTPLSHIPFGDMYVHKTPPTPPQNTPIQKSPPAPPRPAPPRVRRRRLPPAGVVLSVEKGAPRGPLPPAERTSESGVNAAACMRRHMRRRACGGVNSAA